MTKQQALPPIPVQKSLPGNSEKTDLTCSDQQETPEINGPKGPEPTRYGDWERKGRCVDF